MPLTESLSCNCRLGIRFLSNSFTVSKVLFDFLVSLSSSFRYKDCNKQKAHEGDGGVEPEGPRPRQAGLEQVGEGEGRYEGEETHPAHSHPAGENIY